jgi:hypothetical protein
VSFTIGVFVSMLRASLFVLLVGAATAAASMQQPLEPLAKFRRAFDHNVWRRRAWACN